MGGVITVAAELYPMGGDFVDFKYVTQDERVQLYNEVWTEPVTVVAQRYGISDNGLGKHLKRLWIPLPPAGYWAKVQSGQTVTKPNLPPVTGELRRYVHNYFIKFKRPMEELSDDELKSADGLNFLTDETVAAIHEICAQIKVKGQLRNLHRLIEGHKEESAYRKKRDKELKKASWNDNYNRTIKSKYRDNQPMLPIEVSDTNLNRAYRILDRIMWALEEMEGGTGLANHYGDYKDGAYFSVMRTAFYFLVTEQKRKGRKSGKELPPMVLSIQYTTWFRDGDIYRLEYKDEQEKPLEEQVGAIICDMFVAANKMMAQSHLIYREEIRELEEDERQSNLEQMRNGTLIYLKVLEQAASEWDKAHRIRRFLDAMAEKIAEVSDQDKQARLLDWLQWAWDKADWLDPLTNKEDELLGKSKHLFDTILEIDK